MFTAVADYRSAIGGGGFKAKSSSTVLTALPSLGVTRGVVIAKFLSNEWAEEVDRTLNSHAGFKSAIGNADLGIAFNVASGPDGDVSYYLKTAGGDIDLALGNLEGADVTINANYDTAAAISKGDLNVQTAFMTGKLKVAGNLAKLMMHQGAIVQWSAAVKDLPTDY